MCRELLSTQAVEQLKFKTKSGDMAIHLAAKRKDIDMIKILIDYGASVDSQNVGINYQLTFVCRLTVYI